MRWSLRILGILVASLDIEPFEYDSEGDTPSIGGGATHNFSLVGNQHLVSEIEGDPWEDHQFGFRRP